MHTEIMARYPTIPIGEPDNEPLPEDDEGDGDEDSGYEDEDYYQCGPLAQLALLQDPLLLAAFMGRAPTGYIGPERQLPAIGGTWDPIRDAKPRLTLAPPPPSPEMVRAALPEGWTYLGPRDSKNGLVWEAQHRLGVAFGKTPGELIERVKLIHDTLRVTGAAPKPQDDDEGGWTRRRKRKRQDRSLVRCQIPACGGLVWADALEKHVKECHPGARKYTPANRVKDDGTGEDGRLDDPALARAVEAEV